MAQQTLFELLTRTEIPSIPISSHIRRTANTRSDAYPPDSVQPAFWNGFSYATIMHSQYAATLFNTNVVKDPPNSPTKPVSGEPGVVSILTEYVKRAIRRALNNSTFPYNHTNMCIGTGEMASLGASNTQPDFVGYPDIGPDIPGVRLPGDVKCSWKWHSSWRSPRDHFELTEFRAVIAQLNHYMVHTESRYGYILSDAELVVFRKLDNRPSSHIEMAPGIPLTRHDSTGTFTQNSGQPTALLVLWYLHMLASNDNSWWLQEILSDPEEDMDTSGNFV